MTDKIPPTIRTKYRCKRKRTSSAVPVWLACLTAVVHRVDAVPLYSCDAMADTCPTKFNGKCERSVNPACSSGDCYDCDECRQFQADCNSCIKNGCYYCPGDATCFNSPHYVMTNVFSHCTDPADFLKDTCLQRSNFFLDPMYGAQAWVYEMIRVEEVWQQGILGNGVRVRVNDNGVQSNHVEFEGRFDIEGSCDLYDPQELASSTGSHGTSVAAIIGAAANNGECSVGIAPKVTISSCYVFDGSNYFTHKLDAHDISQNSYGIDGCLRRTGRHLQEGSCPFQYVESETTFPCNVCEDLSNPSIVCEDSIKQHCQRNFELDANGCLEFLDIILGGNCLYDVLNDWQRDAIIQGITQGRNGKGIIYIFASGNAYQQGDDTNVQAYTNSRFTISVGGVGKDRAHASYSTPGASLFVVAPGGDSENVANHVTAGLDGTCRNAGSGTSFACPVVSGVVALMLQANPDLTWRDVQHIIAGTSQRVMDWNDDTNFENDAGFWHSNLYGFGIIDAAAAVEAALTWDLVGPEKMLMVESGLLNLPLLDNESAILTTTLRLRSSSPNFAIESVVVQLDLEHFARGHLEIILKSPQGTESVLHPGRRPENTQLDSQERWKFLTVRNWGESPDGNWTLSIVDRKEGDAGECASRPWSVQLGTQVVDCNLIDRISLCVDGVLDPKQQLTDALYSYIFEHQDNGLKATDACCSCGGGMTQNEVTDQLRQWTLVVYGYENNTISGRTVTEAPTRAATNAPTKIPTREPTDKPSSRPSPSPSAIPSPMPSQKPSGAPSTQPSNAPTVAHSGSPSPLPSLQPSSIDSPEPTNAMSNSPTTSPSVVASHPPSEAPSATVLSNPTMTAIPSRPPLLPETTPPNLRPTETTTHHPISRLTAPPSNFPSSAPTETIVELLVSGDDVGTNGPSDGIGSVGEDVVSMPSVAPSSVSISDRQEIGDTSENPTIAPSMSPSLRERSKKPISTVSFPPQPDTSSTMSAQESELASIQKSGSFRSINISMGLLLTVISVVLLKSF